MKRWLIVAATALVITWLTAPSALAANSAVIPGVAISPALQQLVLSPKATSLPFEVQLYNHTAQPVTLQLSTADFSSLNETGGVAFLGNNVSSVTNPHGLAGFLRLGSKTVNLAPNAADTLQITIINANKLAAGGHYAAILAQVVTPPSSASHNHVTLNQVVSSLVFMETAGTGTKTIRLLSPPLDKVSFTLPTSLNLVFKATGNTQAVPRGSVTIGRDGIDQPTLTGLININSSLILPNSTRLLQTSLSGPAHPWWPERYQLHISYHYDGSLGVSSYDTSFIYINPLALVITLAVVVAGLWLLWRLYRAGLGLKLLRSSRSLVRRFSSKPLAAPTTTEVMVEPVDSEQSTEVETTVVEVAEADRTSEEAPGTPDTSTEIDQFAQDEEAVADIAPEAPEFEPAIPAADESPAATDPSPIQKVTIRVSDAPLDVPISESLPVPRKRKTTAKPKKTTKQPVKTKSAVKKSTGRKKTT